MPVTSSRRSSYVAPSSTTSYRSNYSSTSSTSNSLSYKDSSPITSRYNFGDTSSSYRSYRPSTLTSGISSSTSGSFRSRYDTDSSSLSTRIGVSRTSNSTNGRFKSDTLPPLPSSVTSPNNALHDSASIRNQRNTGSKLTLMDNLHFYEKYSPSRYCTQYELSRSRSLTEAATTLTIDKPQSQSNSITNDTPSLHTSNTIRSVALRKALPTTSASTWDRDTGSSLYSGRSSLNDSKPLNKIENGESRNSLSTTSYAAGGYRGSNLSPSKSPVQDSIYDRKNSSSTVEGQCGLWNIGNTCFMNSVLQCLSHTQDLTKFARSANALTSSTRDSSTSSAKDQKIWTEFCKVIQQMWQTGAKCANLSELKMAVSSKYRMYVGSAQQDAQEFLRYLLDSLHGALNKGGRKASLHIDDTMTDLQKANLMWEWYTKRENSVIKDLFVGQLKSSLFCTHCEKTSVMYDPFWDLSVPVPSSSTCKLDKCLELFTVKDVLDGNEMPYCDYCKTTRKCIKGFTIQRFPKYLAIHLKRFSEMRWTKLTTIVEFPTGIAELDLRPYASDSMEKSDPPPIYSLYGISNHIGSTHGGHYVANIKNHVTKKWYECDDNFVSETRESSLVSSSAYILFYERV